MVGPWYLLFESEKVLKQSVDCFYDNKALLICNALSHFPRWKDSNMKKNEKTTTKKIKKNKFVIK